MKVDSVITLDNDLNCLLLDKTVHNGENYFMAIVLDEKEEPTDESVVLKEIIEGSETYVEKEENPEVLAELLKKFTESLNKFVDNLPDDISA